MKKIVIALALILSTNLFVGCTTTITSTTTTTTTTTTIEDTQHEWLELTGTYDVTYYGGASFHTEQSYLTLTIDADGKCGGLLKITASDLSFSNIERIDTWLYDGDTERLIITFDGGNPVTYEVVEYGNIIKFDDGDFVMILEK